MGHPTRKPIYEILRRQPLPSVMVLGLLQIDFTCLEGVRFYMEDNIIPFQTSAIEELKRQGAACRIVEDVYTFFRDNADGVYKVEFCRFGSPKEREKEEYTRTRDRNMIAELRALLEPLGGKLVVNTDTCEIVRADVSTAAVAAEVAGRTDAGFDVRDSDGRGSGGLLSEAFVMGSDGRDAELMRIAGYSVALRDAPHQVKAVATHVSRWTRAEEGAGREIAEALLGQA